MDLATRRAIAAVVIGLRQGGAITDHNVHAIASALRDAADELGGPSWNHTEDAERVRLLADDLDV